MVLLDEFPLPQVLRLPVRISVSLLLESVAEVAEITELVPVKIPKVKDAEAALVLPAESEAVAVMDLPVP